MASIWRSTPFIPPVSSSFSLVRAHLLLSGNWVSYWTFLKLWVDVTFIAFSTVKSEGVHSVDSVIHRQSMQQSGTRSSNESRHSPLQPSSLPVGQGERTGSHTELKNSSFLCYQGMWSSFLTNAMLLETLNRLCSILFEQEDFKNSVSYFDLLFSQSCGCLSQVFLEIGSPTFSLRGLEAARAQLKWFCWRTCLCLSVDPLRHCCFLGASHSFQFLPPSGDTPQDKSQWPFLLLWSPQNYATQVWHNPSHHSAPVNAAWNASVQT